MVYWRARLVMKWLKGEVGLCSIDNLHLIIMLYNVITKTKTRLKFIDFGRLQSVRLSLCHSLDSIPSLYINNNKIEIN